MYNSKITICAALNSKFTLNQAQNCLSISNVILFRANYIDIQFALEGVLFKCDDITLI